MNAVKLSPKYQVVIPRDVRDNLHLIPGQMMQVIAYGNRIELMPSKDNLRRWISYIVGRGKEKFVAEQIEAIRELDQEVYFVATVLWQILGSWVHDLKGY